MAFGLPNTTDLNGLADKLGTIVAAVGPEESAVITAAIQQLSDHAGALATSAIAQAGGVIQADLAPVVQQVTDFNANVATLIGLLTRVLDDGILVGGKR